MRYFTQFLKGLEQKRIRELQKANKSGKPGSMAVDF